jgi:hypothetical protein
MHISQQGGGAGLLGVALTMITMSPKVTNQNDRYRTMKNSLLTFLLLFASIAGFSQQKAYVVTRYGATGDGITLNTKSIQHAIDAAGQNGGGTVIIPDGHFVTGPLILQSGVTLHLADKAFLLGSTDPYDYPYMREVLIKNSLKTHFTGALIQAVNQKNISITGNGTIDGQGRRLALAIDSLFYTGKLDTIYYNLRRKRPYRRPGNFKFTGCENIRISGINLKNAASWVQTYTQCDHVNIDHIRVESDAYWNNDGIDIVDCAHVRITNSFVNSADDGICLKSETAGHLNDSIYIADCTVRSSASAVKFGTASVGGFKNVTIKNIRVFNTFRSAIALESVDGGILENITVDGIFAVNTGNPIFIRLGHRNIRGQVGSLRNVTIKNVYVEVPFGRPDKDYDLRGPALKFFHNPFPSSITGIPGHPVENVRLENIHISYPGKGNDGLAVLPLYRLKDIPEAADEYPEFSMFGELPAWGIYVRHVRGLTMENISMKARAKDYRPACVFDDVSALDLNNFKVSEEDTGKQFILNNIQHFHLTNMDKSQVTTFTDDLHSL